MQADHQVIPWPLNDLKVSDRGTSVLLLHDDDVHIYSSVWNLDLEAVIRRRYCLQRLHFRPTVALLPDSTAFWTGACPFVWINHRQNQSLAILSALALLHAS